MKRDDVTQPERIKKDALRRESLVTSKPSLFSKLNVRFVFYPHASFTTHFRLQFDDMRFLVESVWRSESLLSEIKDLLQLVFVRWDVDQPLSPWNCVLLTADEADGHVLVPDKSLVYGTDVVKRVLQRHVMAKTHFGELA